MLQTTHLERVFLFEEKGQKLSLADPAQSLSPEAVLNFYANTYPILTTATIQGPVIENDAVQYTFISQMGTKG